MSIAQIHPILDLLNAVDPRILLAAEGYGELGMWQEAGHELETLPSEHRAEVKVQILRLAIFVGLRQWAPAALLADSLVQQGCQDPDLYIQGAYAIRRARSLPEAKVFLIAGQLRNPQCPTIHFNLACYDAQLGHLDAARSWLRQAVKLQPAFHAMALDEEDLRPLWESLPLVP